MSYQVTISDEDASVLAAKSRQTGESIESLLHTAIELCYVLSMRPTADSIKIVLPDNFNDEETHLRINPT